MRARSSPSADLLIECTWLTCSVPLDNGEIIAKNSSVLSHTASKLADGLRARVEHDKSNGFSYNAQPFGDKDSGFLCRFCATTTAPTVESVEMFLFEAASPCPEAWRIGM